jgi:hypothetical protein
VLRVVRVSSFIINIIGITWLIKLAGGAKLTMGIRS